MEYYEYQEEFIANDSLVKLCLWPRRSGKSTSLAECVVREVRKTYKEETYKSKNIAIVGPSKAYTECVMEETTKKLFYDEINSYRSGCLELKSGHTVYTFSTSSYSLLRGSQRFYDMVVFDGIDWIKPEDMKVAREAIVVPSLGIGIIASVTSREDFAGSSELYTSKERGYRCMFNSPGKDNIVELLNYDKCFVSLKDIEDANV